MVDGGGFGGGGATKVPSITADDFDIWPRCRKSAGEGEGRGEERSSGGETANKKRKRRKEGESGWGPLRQFIHAQNRIQQMISVVGWSRLSDIERVHTQLGSSRLHINICINLTVFLPYPVNSRCLEQELELLMTFYDVHAVYRDEWIDQL